MIEDRYMVTTLLEGVPAHNSAKPSATTELTNNFNHISISMTISDFEFDILQIRQQLYKISNKVIQDFIMI